MHEPQQVVKLSDAVGTPNSGDVASSKDPRPTVDTEGTVHLPALTVPISSYMSELAKKRFIDLAEHKHSTPRQDPSSDALAKSRLDVENAFRVKAERAEAHYPVTIEEQLIGGVRTYIVTPKEGIPLRHRNRVLINLHGGGFLVGGKWHGLTESIPLAGIGQFKVVTVDYRMAPEHKFPAASEDVAAVYRALLKQYQPKHIGIYGCSAGGQLTAMAAAWFQKEDLPAPGALGIVSAAAYGRGWAGAPGAPGTWSGDSRYVGPPLMGDPPLPQPWQTNLPASLDYLSDAVLTDPLVSPALSPPVLARFPPTLLITGTRSYDMSAAVQTQRELDKAGVEADLHLWNGMWHCFTLDTELPESQEAFLVMTQFFDTHLGR
jgi:acetyl esterase/lipase